MGVTKTQVVKFIRKGDKGDDGYSVIVADTHTRQFTYATWQTYGAVGHVETWTSIANASSYKIGDTIVINGVCTDRNNAGVSLYATVVTVSGTSVVATTTSLIMGGEKGEQGAVLRGPQAWSDCATGYAFQAGGSGEKWKDVVLYNGNYYSCVKSHTKTSSNYPGSTTAINNGYWQLGDTIELVATKILLATYALVENLGVTAIDMKDSAGNILFQAKDGNVTCKTGTFENVTVSGTLQGVTGSFKSLDCIDSSGNVVCNMSFGSDGRMWFNNGDLYQQGTKNGRSLRFYSSDIWCRGGFGSAQRNVLVVHGSYGYYYTNGVTNSGTYVAFTSATSSDGNTYYTLPCYGSSGDYSGFPVDIIVFRKTNTTTYRYNLSMSNSQRVLLLNAYDNMESGTLKIYANGSTFDLNGGQIREAVKMYTFQYPQQGSTVLGAGLYLTPTGDVDW